MKSLRLGSGLLPAPVEHVRVDLRGAHVAVPEELLDGADVVPVLKRLGDEGVAQGVGRGPLHDPGPPDRTFHYALENGLVQVVPATLAGVPVHIEACRGEDPLPYPLPARVRILPPERRGELDPTRPVLKVAPVLLPDALEIPGQIRLHHRR